MATAQTKTVEKVENPKIEKIEIPPIPNPHKIPMCFITGLWENQYLRVCLYFDENNETYKYGIIRCNKLKARNILMYIEKNIDIHFLEQPNPPSKEEILKYFDDLLKEKRTQTNEKIILNPPEDKTYIYLYKVIPYLIKIVK